MLCEMAIAGKRNTYLSKWYWKPSSVREPRRPLLPWDESSLLWFTRWSSTVHFYDKDLFRTERKHMENKRRIKIPFRATSPRIPAFPYPVAHNKWFSPRLASITIPAVFPCSHDIFMGVWNFLLSKSSATLCLTYFKKMLIYVAKSYLIIYFNIETLWYFVCHYSWMLLRNTLIYMHLGSKLNTKISFNQNAWAWYSLQLSASLRVCSLQRPLLYRQLKHKITSQITIFHSFI